MSLAALKYDCSWEQLRYLIRIKGRTFMKLIVGFIEKLYSFMIERLVRNYENAYSMKYSFDNDNLLRISPFALEVVDVLYPKNQIVRLETFKRGRFSFEEGTDCTVLKPKCRSDRTVLRTRLANTILDRPKTYP